jgi:hypothetical protein
MTQPRNIQFTLLIKAEERQREFNFRKRTDTLFDVDTADERGNRFSFKLELKDNHWVIATVGLPPWIQASGPSIHAALLKQSELS